MENLYLTQSSIIDRAVALISPYYSHIHLALINAYEETKKIKDYQLERGVICTMTPTTKGSIMSNVMEYYLQQAFLDIEGVKIVKIDNVSGLLFSDKVFIKFNKLDESNKPSIQQRKWYKAITNQGTQIEGLPKQIIKMWAGIIPIDKQWSDIARCSIIYYEGGNAVWSTNLTDASVKQLSIDIIPTNTKRRTTPKNKEGNQDTLSSKTGTDNT